MRVKYLLPMLLSLDDQPGRTASEKTLSMAQAGSVVLRCWFCPGGLADGRYLVVVGVSG